MPIKTKEGKKVILKEEFIDDNGVTLVRKVAKPIEKGKVTTIAGDLQLIKDCIVLGNKYYLKDRDAILCKPGNTYVPKAFILEDNFTKEVYDFRQISLLECYIDMKGKAGFSSKVFKGIVKERTAFYCESLLSHFRDSYSLEGFKVQGKEPIRPAQRTVKTYSMSSLPSQYIEKIRKGISITNKSWRKFFDKTYGIEIETSEGDILPIWYEKFGFAKLYDGSIYGHEYASVPFTGETLPNVIEFCKVLRETHRHNYLCSVHVHFGTIPYSNDNLLSLYTLYSRLQEELFAIVAPYKKEYDYIRNKLGDNKKDHCKYLPLLPNKKYIGEHAVKNRKEAVEQIYTYFTGRNIDANEIGNFENAEILTSNNKWALNRYYFVNFLNYILKGGTIEARLHHNTFLGGEILLWTALNQAIIDYALTRKEDVLSYKIKISLDDVIDTLPESIRDIVVAFVETRRKRYFNLKLERASITELLTTFDRSYSDNSTVGEALIIKTFNEL